MSLSKGLSSMASANMLSPQASRYSRNDIGYMVTVSTFPTGGELSASLTPRRDPAQITSYLPSSQKYFSAVMARGHCWISSSTIRVSVVIGLLRRIPSILTILSTLRSGSKTSDTLVSSQETYAMSSYCSVPNSLMMYVLPHWRTPKIIMGL